MKRRAASIAVLINLLGASWGVTRKPSDIKLKWLQDEVKDDHKLPHMEITFADGSKDEVFLNTDPENDCFFHGKLKTDIESTVVVDGCKNDDATILINSRLVPCGYVSLHFETTSKWTGQLPQSVVAKIHVRYDESLVQQYGSRQEAEKGVRAIIDLSRPWFKKRRNGLLMEVEIKVLTLQYYAGTIPHPGSHVHAMKQLKGKGAMDRRGYPTAWFRSNKCLNPHGTTRCSMTGLGDRTAFCRPCHLDLGGYSFYFFLLHL